MSDGRTWRCCVHCDDDPVHDVPDDGHDLPCDIGGCQAKAPAGWVSPAAHEAAVDAARTEALAPVLALHRRLGHPDAGLCHEDGDNYPCPTVRAAGATGTA